MVKTLNHRVLKSRITSYLVTTAFNFGSISLLLFLSYSLVPSRFVATLIAHAAGMLFSMFFSIDFWWTRVSQEMSTTISIQQRLRFLGLASIAAVLSALITSLAFFRNAETLSLVIINWVVLAFVSITKYIAIVIFVQNNKGNQN